VERWAREVAQELLARPLPRRWRHVQAVGAAAERIRAALEPDGELLVAAAYLHDIGYSPLVADTGFHQLDGARFLRDHGAPVRLVDLVAHHSLARADAADQGWAAELAEFTDERTAVRDALWFCDMTTGPDGQTMTVRERIAEIGRRYGPQHPKTRIRRATAVERLRVAHRAHRLLRAAGLVPAAPADAAEQPRFDLVGASGSRTDGIWLRRTCRTITEDLADSFGWLPVEQVAAVVRATMAELSGSAVTDYLPVLVQRQAARRLESSVELGDVPGLCRQLVG
jgi:putative nucleotidyltransferase with HDIG domain